jgi:hypothetical protein
MCEGEGGGPEHSEVGINESYDGGFFLFQYYFVILLDLSLSER